MSLEDKLYPLLKLYKNSPYFMKKGLGIFYNAIPDRLKYGRFYTEYLGRINTFNSDAHQNLLLNQLNFAVRNIPFYKGASPHLQDFDIIDKNIIRKNFDLLSTGDDSLKLIANTGGSSGTPFTFFLHKGISRPKEKAHFDWYWGQFGYRPGDKMLILRGEPLSNNKLFEFQAIGNKLAISCYLLNNDNIDTAVKAIERFNPAFIHGYPSAVKNFANLLLASKNNVKIDIRALFLGSEGLYPGDREFLEKFFNARVINWYGHSERLIHAGNCPYSDEYHVYPFYGHIELLNEENLPVSPNEKGRIVATGFDNKCMPFIRYDTGDEAILSPIKNCQCGFSGISLSSIVGRKQDYVYLSDESKVSVTAFIFGQHFNEFSKIQEMQLEQVTPGSLLVRLLVASNWSSHDSQSLKYQMEYSVDNKIKIELEKVNFIKKSRSGKHRFIIQHIGNETSNSKL